MADAAAGVLEHLHGVALDVGPRLVRLDGGNDEHVAGCLGEARGQIGQRLRVVAVDDAREVVDRSGQRGRRRLRLAPRRRHERGQADDDQDGAGARSHRPVIDVVDQRLDGGEVLRKPARCIRDGQGRIERGQHRRRWCGRAAIPVSPSRRPTASSRACRRGEPGSPAGRAAPAPRRPRAATPRPGPRRTRGSPRAGAAGARALPLRRRA